MTVQTMSDELLISSYHNAVKLNINDNFIELLYSEIERRNIQHLLPHGQSR
ncbi:developmental checkpoint coupling sporulation initiation to replication initiation [Cytobacillus oceanisediminis]|uniref:Developmental checkpoint coupling sporulation initiation to replication initiation n=1 Tax=Cytobacillus oceanisediminis TaxID=665099 RepID=A0A2V3A8M3_9BACI|nr:developmental checkpoint coupling sporulation initiation to replication initiation [Cytobacillus oceanisediminis]